MFPHISGEVIPAIILTVARLIAYIIDNPGRYRRTLVLVLLTLAVITVRWALADGGVHVLLHDFSQAAIARPHQRFG